MTNIGQQIIAVLTYLGVGALAHVLFVGATFDFTSPWTVAALFGWPFLLTLALGVVAVAVCVVVVGFNAVAELADWLNRRAARAKRQREVDEMKRQRENAGMR